MKRLLLAGVTALVSIGGIAPVQADHDWPEHWSKEGRSYAWINIIDRLPREHMPSRYGGNFTLVYDQAIDWMYGPGYGHIYINYTKEDPAWGCNKVPNAIVACWVDTGPGGPAGEGPCYNFTRPHVNGGDCYVRMDNDVVFGGDIQLKRGVARHELGHVLGRLGHSAHGGPMGGGFEFVPHDYEAFRRLYGHSD